MNIRMQKTIEHAVFNSFGSIPRSGIAGSYESSIFHFLRKIHAIPVYMPTNSAQVFPFLHMLTNTSFVFLIIAILCGVITHIVLIYICLTMIDAENFLLYNHWISVSSLLEMPAQVLCHL